MPIEMNTLTSGPNKDVGSPFRPMANPERKLLQNLIDHHGAEVLPDSWRLSEESYSQFPAYPGTEYTTSYLKFEYILEKLEATDG